MHSASQSPRSADFRVAAQGADVADLLGPPSTPDPEPAAPVTGRGDLLGALRASWDDWVPVAATGWGAVVLIAPLLVVHTLVWMLGGRRGA